MTRALAALALLSSLASACSGNGPTQATDSLPVAPAEAEPDASALLRLDERAFPLLIWAAHTVQEEYYDKGRFDPREQLRWALHDLGIHAPEFFAEVVGDGRIKVTVGDASEAIELGEVSSLLGAAEILEKVLVFARAHLDLADEEAVRRLEYAAINGFLAPLDPHTVLLNPEERSDLGVRTKGEFGGIGAEIVIEARRIRVTRIVAGSPAERAGLLAGDLILQIDKQATVNFTQADAMNLLRGPVDSEVVLKISRQGEVKTLKIVRKIIKIESVIATRLPGDVGHLRMTVFQENTADQARAAIAAMQAEGPLRALVLDLRGNTGGLLTQAMEVVDLLVDAGELVIVKSAAGREAEAAKPEAIVGPEVGVVALVDEGAASGSEVVSGGLRALGRGVVVGRRSFGKGTVQMLKPIAPYGKELALKLTVAEYQVAGDHRIQTVGVEPDLALYPVEITDIPGVVRYYDQGRFERERERAQIAHLPSARHDPAITAELRDAALLRYLGGPRALAEGEPDLLRDPEVAIAREIALAIAGGKDEGARRSALNNVQKGIAAREDAAIVAALKDAGVAWSGQPGGHGEAPLAVSATLTSRPPLRAGVPFVLRVEVENPGDAPAERVHLITECVHDELDGIEVLMGTIPPGQKVSRDLRLQVMSWHPDFTGALGLKVHSGEPDGAPDAAASVRLEVTGQPRPAIAYDWWIVDDPALVPRAPARPADGGAGEPFTVAGNGDGVLQPGERVLLAVRAENQAKAPAGDVRALLRNKSGDQGLLEEGFCALGPIAGGGRARGAFGISVAEGADRARPLELDLMVADVQLHESARHRLRLGLGEARPAFAAEAGRFKVKAEGARLYNGADARAPVLAELPGGWVFEGVGRAGGWLAVELEPGRRAWVPADLVAPAAKGERPSPAPARPALLVGPPTIEVAGAPTTVAGASLTLQASARHPGRVKDLVIAVAPVGPYTIEDKVFYMQNPLQSPARDGDGARVMEATAVIPLEPGPNRITITARDGDDVAADRELLVLRE